MVTMEQRVEYTSRMKILRAQVLTGLHDMDMMLAEAQARGMDEETLKDMRVTREITLLRVTQ